MNIVVLSGGSGNDALIKGLKSIYKNVNVKVIVNAYDNGKSTGVCRCVTNTLGVSDIRKNHIRMYKAITDVQDQRLIEFYEKRFDFGSDIDDVKCKINELLDSWGLSELKVENEWFFRNPKAKDFVYNDFSVANIIYAAMYQRHGYENTNRFFTERILGIKDFVILNSFDNVYINGITKHGNVVEDEGDLVDYKNPEDPFVWIKYTGEVNNEINPEAIRAVSEADLIVISTGTFWSSIYPTLDYSDFYKFINDSKAKKIWAINNNEDKDAYGVSSNDFINIFEELGLNLNDFTILENTDAVESLRLPNEKYNIVYKSMENNKGKHDGYKYAKAIFSIYYGIDNVNTYDKILFDFDDTIWARDCNKFTYNLEQSVENIKLVNSIPNAAIISGNSYSSIKEKLSRVFGTNMEGFTVDVWADANSVLYKNNEMVDSIMEAKLSRDTKAFVKSILEDFKITFTVIGPTNIKIKGLTELERDLLVYVINNSMSGDYLNARAIKAGKTTVDIVSKLNSKARIINKLNLEGKNTLYIGDEVDNGNDKDIAKLCKTSIHTSGVEETNILLKLLIEG